MAKRKRATTDATIANRLKAGRGHGKGDEYIPWLKIQDVPSNGLASRVRGIKTNRVHHLMSKLELRFFYILEWSPSVLDVREQFPLIPRETTMLIAEELGITHPADPKTQTPIVMTSDFRITVLQNGTITDIVRTVKPMDRLRSERVMGKLEIERRYWHIRDVDWAIVTENEIPINTATNIETVRSYHSIDEHVRLSDTEIADISSSLTDRVLNNELPLRTIAMNCDNDLGLKLGTSLSISYHLIATRQWAIDMKVPLNPAQRIKLMRVSLNQ